MTTIKDLNIIHFILSIEKTNDDLSVSYEFQSNIDYIYHYATDVHMDHKIWADPADHHMKRHSDAAFHLYARINLTSIWHNANRQQHLVKIEVKTFF